MSLTRFHLWCNLKIIYSISSETYIISPIHRDILRPIPGGIPPPALLYDNVISTIISINVVRGPVTDVKSTKPIIVTFVVLRIPTSNISIYTPFYTSNPSSIGKSFLTSYPTILMFSSPALFATQDMGVYRVHWMLFISMRWSILTVDFTTESKVWSSGVVPCHILVQSNHILPCG